MKRTHLATWNKDKDFWEVGTDIFGRSVAYSVTLPKSGMTHAGQLYELQISEHPTTAPGSFSLPTPKASDSYLGSTARTTGRPIERSTHLGTIVCHHFGKAAVDGASMSPPSEGGSES